ncbi:MAG TPA: type II secretion system F family protein [Gammaproteobacteria bacterium]|nr:type II secretion system F family protein [Gammaproteobacteria bacterium]HET7588431.1 type II secretion system F family protein [Gammaproteobacteria bacterium]
MAAFQYKGRTTRGDLVNGRLEADTAEAVADQLFTIGVTPIDIAPAPPAATEVSFSSFKKLLSRERPKLDDLILFSRQMYSLTKGGVPLVRALQGLAASTHNLMLRETIQQVVESLASGRELANTLARHPKVFSPLYVNIVRVGENSGNLQEAFQRLAQYLSFDKDTRRRIRTAFRYPVVVITFVAVAIAILTTFVIPKFATLFGHFDIPLPWPTRVILAVSEFASRDWPFVLGALAIGFAALRLWLKTDNGRYRWDRWMLKMPIVGDIVLRSALARFARGFAMAYRAGVPLISTLTLTGHALGNAWLRERVLEMRTGVERGESLSHTAAAAGLFPPLVLQMLMVGEETGTVDDMLDEVGDFYESEIEYKLQTLSAAIEPVLIVVLGIMVLILALGVFLPMWDISRLAQH